MGGERGSGLLSLFSLLILLSLLRLLSPSLGRSKTSLVVWLLCFSSFQVEPQYLSLGFYYLCYSGPHILRQYGKVLARCVSRIHIAPPCLYYSEIFVGT